MKKYRPNRPPGPDEWLAMDEDERMNLVSRHHKKTGIPMPELHTIIHVIVENQLAEGLDFVREALDRLIAEGLDRHEAIHAIGSVLADHLWSMMQDEQSEGFSNEQYLRDLESLTVESWIRNTDPGSE